MSLGSIVVRLTMNTADFETDAGRAAKIADKRAREIDASFKRAGKAIGLALAAGATAAVVAIKSTIDHMDEMSKAAQKVGVSTEEFSKLTYAAQLADVSMDTLASAMGKLTKSQAAALNASSQQAKVFEALGISIKDASGNLRSSSDVLVEFADRFKALQGSPEAMAAGFALFGRSFQDLIPLLNDGGAGIRAAGDELESLGGVLNTKAGQAAQEFNDNLESLKVAAGALAMQVASELLPELISLTKNLIDLTKEGGNAAGIGSTIANGFKIAVGAFITLDATVRGVTSDLIAFLKIMQAVGQARGFDFKGAAESMKQAGIARQQAAEQSKRIEAVFDGTAFQRKPDFSNVRGTPTPLPDIDASRLRGAFAGPAKKAKASGGKSDAEREAERLQQGYDRMVASLKEQAALTGVVSETERLRYELANGELAKLTPAQKEELINLSQIAELRKQDYELTQKAIQQEEDRQKEIDANRKRADEMISDMEFELRLMGLSNVEREKEIALRYAGADATEAQREAIGHLVEETERARELTSFMDDFRSSLADTFVSVVDGSKSAKEAFTEFFDDMAAKITRMIAEKWIEKLFGSQGSTGSGTSGGDVIGGLFGAIFGGGRASGGVAMPNTLYEVNERGFEMATVGGRDYMLTGNSPVQITPNERVRAGRTANLTQTFIMQGKPDRRTREQLARDAGREARRGMSRTGA